MPIYTIRINAAEPDQQDQELGFYKDRAATDYARRIARGAPVEVWREGELIERLEAPAPEPAV